MSEFLEEVYAKTDMYRSVRDVTTDMIHFTLIRIAKSNANMFIQQCQNESSDEEERALFMGIVIALDHQAILVALHDQLANGLNNALKEIYGLQVAILGELLSSDFGKKMRGVK